jgi:hypothetical protein
MPPAATMPPVVATGQGKLGTSRHGASEASAQEIVRPRPICATQACRAASCLCCPISPSISHPRAQAHSRMLTQLGACLP